MKLNFTKKQLIIGGAVVVVVVALAVGLGVGLSGKSDNDSGGDTATTATTTTATTAAPIANLPLTRLPTALVPEHYNVTLQPSIGGDFTFLGNVTIHISVVEATNQIVLHMAAINTHNDTIKLVRVDDFSSTTGTEVTITKHSYNPELQFYVGDIAEELTAGEKIVFSLTFTGTLNDQMRGFYRSSYENEMNEIAYLAMTQMSPNDARMAFPCFDEPALKATFNISIIRSESLTAVANTPLLYSEPLADNPGWVKDVFKITPKMSTYLVAFVVSDFVNKTFTIDSGRVQLRVRTRPAAIAQAEYAGEVARSVLPYFEEFFSIEYPLDKLDMVAVPDFAAGAMENWGLITYRETAMLYDATLSTPSNKQRVGVVVAHELAHQWFGNLVTPAWWSDIWLNEGFASYMEYIGLDHHEPEWGMLNMFVYEDLQAVMVQDSQLTSHPVSMEVNTTAQITALFDNISYRKGACLVRMLRNSLGDATFQRGLTNYLNEHQMSAATQDDLWSALDAKAKTDGSLPSDVSVKEIMDTWTLQMGYPYINVTRDANGRVTVTQKRFLSSGSSNDSPNEPAYMWWIPLSYSSQSSVEPTHNVITWMNQSETTMVIDYVLPSNEWIIFNVQQFGYYRVNYDSSNWQSLTGQLLNDPNAIHDTNRAQLLDDVFNLARAGIVPYETALNLCSYLFKERAYVPWASAIRNLEYLESMFTGTASYAHLVAFLLNQISPLYGELISISNSSLLTHQEQLLQTATLSMACRLEYDDCLNFATNYFDEWIQNGSAMYVPPNFKSAVYCTGVAQRGADAWDSVWQLYLASDLATESVLLLQALGCSKNTTTLQNYLKMAFNETSGIKKQDAPTVFAAVAANDLGRSLAWQYLSSNWDDIVASSDAFTTLSTLVNAATAEFSTQEELNQLQEFQEQHSNNLGTAEQAVQQAVERTETNIAWIDEYFDSIVAWLTALTVRLPRSLTPLHYDVTLQPILEGDFPIHGRVSILMRVEEHTARIVLHAAEIAVAEESIEVRKTNLPGEIVPYASHEYNSDFEFFIVNLNTTLAAAESVVLTMNFTGVLNDQLRGFYRSVYQDEQGNDVYIATTQFQPTDARRAFPCFDEPALKANFSISIIRDENRTAISNMPLKSSTPLTDQPGWFVDQFAESVPMSTYLVAFVVSDFANLTSTTLPGPEFRVFARKEGVNTAQFALDTGVDVLEFFEGYFSIQYPLPKQDMFAIPDFAAGAMENWGLITYRESSFLYNKSISTTSNLQRVGIIVSHELAHQWFGNLVTPSWWTDLWLNEGFASYMEYIGLNHSQPTWNMMDQFVSVDLHYVMAIDALSSSHPISITVENPDEINEIFDVISYSKGASIIRMMSHFLTEETFNAGITNYLNGSAYEAANQSQLWDYLTDEAHRSGTLDPNVTVHMIMDTWTLQMGFPVVTVNRTGDGTTATVKQEHFLLSGQASSSYTWWVPLTYVVQPGSGSDDVIRETIWLVHAEINVTDLPPSSSWVIFNYEQTGYYRVNYDTRNWNLIITQLKNDPTTISAINRAQILDDSANLARAGLLPYETALRIYSYLSSERDYVPWYSAIRNLKYIESMFSSTGNYSIMQEALQNLVLPVYEALSFNELAQDSHLTLLHRTLVVSWACALELPDCLTSASALFSNWVTDGGSETRVPANLKSTVYCVGIAEGGLENWTFAWDVAQRTDLASERDLLLTALGCSKNETILTEYLERAFTAGSGVRKQDSSRVFEAVASNHLGRELAWNYLSLNFVNISAYSSSFLSAGSYIEAATQEMNTATELTQLLAFKEKYSAVLGSASRATDQAIERVTTNIAWMEANFDSLLGFVSSLNSTSPSLV